MAKFLQQFRMKWILKYPKYCKTFSFAFLPQNRKYELPLRTKNIFFSLTSNSTHDLYKIPLYIDGYLLGEEDDQYILDELVGLISSLKFLEYFALFLQILIFGEIYFSFLPEFF